MTAESPRRWRRALLNVVIAAHLVALFIWGLPDNNFSMAVLKPARPYFSFVGLWHTWNMFAPDVSTIQTDLRANVKYQDGTVREWIAPRLHQLSAWERAIKGRYRKWRSLNFHDNYAMTWDSTARYVARQMNSNATNPPVRVELVRYWNVTPPIMRRRDYQPMISRNISYPHSYRYAVCPITPQDL